MLPLRILVRTATPWETMTLAEFYKQSGELLPQNAIKTVQDKGLIESWEKAYGRSYFKYRADIRRVCERRLASISSDYLTIGLVTAEWLKSEQDEIIIPIDDDDTLEPSIVDIKKVFSPGVNIVVWQRNTHYMNVPESEQGRDAQLRPKQSKYLDSCNWAIRKSFLQRWSHDNAKRILARHQWACRQIAIALGLAHEENNKSLLGQAARARLLTRGIHVPLEHPSVIEVDACWSTYYLHSASISFLARKMAPHIDTVQYLKGLPLHPLLANVPS